MWLFTRHGFFSVVELDGNKHFVAVRARAKGHLEALKAKYPDHLGNSAILKSGVTRDYGYRMIISKAAWIVLAQLLASDVDYGNFKDAVSARAARIEGGEAYGDALHEVWREMVAFQNVIKDRT